MARLATEDDFERGGLYDAYREYPFFAQRAAWIAERFPTDAGPVLVAGCAWGYLVKHLLPLGFDAYGFDGAQYAIDKIVPEAQGRVLLADAMNRSQVAAVRSLAGLRGNERFALVVTEDVLPCLTESEAGIVVAECRRVADAVLHIVTCGQTTDPHRVAGLTWKAQTEWRALLGAADTCLDAETGETF